MALPDILRLGTQASCGGWDAERPLAPFRPQRASESGEVRAGFRSLHEIHWNEG